MKPVSFPQKLSNNKGWPFCLCSHKLKYYNCAQSVPFWWCIEVTGSQRVFLSPPFCFLQRLQTAIFALAIEAATAVWVTVYLPEISSPLLHPKRQRQDCSSRTGSGLDSNKPTRSGGRTTDTRESVITVAVLSRSYRFCSSKIIISGHE